MQLLAEDPVISTECDASVQAASLASDVTADKAIAVDENDFSRDREEDETKSPDSECRHISCEHDDVDDEQNAINEQMLRSEATFTTAATSCNRSAVDGSEVLVDLVNQLSLNGQAENNGIIGMGLNKDYYITTPLTDNADGNDQDVIQSHFGGTFTDTDAGLKGRGPGQGNQRVTKTIRDGENAKYLRTSFPPACNNTLLLPTINLTVPVATGSVSFNAYGPVMSGSTQHPSGNCSFTGGCASPQSDEGFVSLYSPSSVLSDIKWTTIGLSPPVNHQNASAGMNMPASYRTTSSTTTENSLGAVVHCTNGQSERQQQQQLQQPQTPFVHTDNMFDSANHTGRVCFSQTTGVDSLQQTHASQQKPVLLSLDSRCPAVLPDLGPDILAEDGDLVVSCTTSQVTAKRKQSDCIEQSTSVAQQLQDRARYAVNVPSINFLQQQHQHLQRQQQQQPPPPPSQQQHRQQFYQFPVGNQCLQANIQFNVPTPPPIHSGSHLPQKSGYCYTASSLPPNELVNNNRHMTPTIGEVGHSGTVFSPVLTTVHSSPFEPVPRLQFSSVAADRIQPANFYKLAAIASNSTTTNATASHDMLNSFRNSLQSETTNIVPDSGSRKQYQHRRPTQLRTASTMEGANTKTIELNATRHQRFLTTARAKSVCDTSPTTGLVGSLSDVCQPTQPTSTPVVVISDDSNRDQNMYNNPFLKLLPMHNDDPDLDALLEALSRHDTDGSNDDDISTSLSSVSPAASSSSASSPRHSLSAVASENDLNLESDSRSVASIIPSNSHQLLLQDDFGDTVLHRALIEDDGHLALKLVNEAVNYGVISDVVRIRNNQRQTVLGLAVITNKPEVVRQLLQYGADVNVTIASGGNKAHDQPLHVAASRGCAWLNTLRHLLQHPKIEINAFNSDGRSPLHCALLHHGQKSYGVSEDKIDSSSTILELVQNGADLNLPDISCDKTPLHYAIDKRDSGLVQLILELAAELSGTGVTRLLSSAAIAFRRQQQMTSSNRNLTGKPSPRGDASKDLIWNMLNARNGTGNTALHMVTSLRHVTPQEKHKMVRLLLCRGADPSTKNSDGQLPRDLTCDPTIINLLRGTSRRM